MTDSNSNASAPGIASDSLYWYNLGNLAPYGLAIPNWGTTPTTVNSPIYGLVRNVGKMLQSIMFDNDVYLQSPPSPNTVKRMVQLIDYFRAEIGGRQFTEGLGRMHLKPVKAQPPVYTFQVFPTQFFNVINPWLAEYGEYILLMLEEAMQSDENTRPLEITPGFASTVSQYPQRVYQMIAKSLLRIPTPPGPSSTTSPNIGPTNALAPNPADPADPNFVITPAMLDAYNPSAWYNPAQQTANATPPSSLPAMRTIQSLSNGFPVTSLPPLPFWPGPAPADISASSAPPAVPANTLPAFAPPPGA